MIDPGFWKDWATLVINGITIAGFLYLWFTRGSKDNARKLEKIEAKLIDHDRRIQKVENDMEHMPDKEAVHDLMLAIAELKGTVSTYGERLTGVGKTVDRIDEFLKGREK